MSITYLFNDDQGRKYAGYHGWLDWSRWTDTLLSNFIHTDIFLYDIAPLTQIIACIILALASYFILEIVFDEETYSIPLLLSTVIIGVNPYFLRCFECKYDIPYMAISICVSFVPAYFFEKSNKIVGTKKYMEYCIISIICLLIMLTSYQSSAGIYPMVVTVIVLKKIYLDYGKRDIIAFCISSILNYLFSIFIFLNFFLLKRSDSGSWTAVTTIQDVFNNYIDHYFEIFRDFNFLWIVLAVVVCLLFIVLYVMTYKRNKFLGLLFCIVGVAVISFVAFGANLFIGGKNMLEANYLYGAMIGLSLITSFLIYLIILNFKNSNKIINAVKTIIILITGYLTYCFISYSYIYGNVLEEQWRYQDFRVKEIIYDLTDLEIMCDAEEKEVTIIGSIGLSPVNRQIQNLRLIEKLLPATLTGNDIWGEFYFRYYFDIPNISTGTAMEIDNIDFSEFLLLQESSYHKIYSSDNKLLIVIENPEQVEWKTN